MWLIHYVHYGVCPYRREGEVADTERQRERHADEPLWVGSEAKRDKGMPLMSHTGRPRTDSFPAISGAASPTDTLTLDFWSSEL